MDFLYRNKNSFPITVDLGGKNETVLPNSTLLVPEKFDYVIEKRKIALTREIEESICQDIENHPEEWIVSTEEETLKQIELDRPIDFVKPIETIKKPGRKKKVK